MRPLTVLTLSGSLRKASLNTAMLTMAADCAPPGLRVKRHRGLGDLPLFNPDLEAHEPPRSRACDTRSPAADALLIASPEYAHGVSGVMKNALDWMVAERRLRRQARGPLERVAARFARAGAPCARRSRSCPSRLVDEAGLEVLIKSPEAGAVPVNPDPERHAACPCWLCETCCLPSAPSRAPARRSLIATPITLTRPPKGSAAAW